VYSIIGYLVGLVTSSGLPLHFTAVHFNRSNMHRDGRAYIDGRSYVLDLAFQPDVVIEVYWSRYGGRGMRR
jgi:hypothetical protein